MIPQLQERIVKLEAISQEQQRQIDDLRENLSDLREYLQVERRGIAKLAEPMPNYPSGECGQRQESAVRTRW